MNNFYNLIYYPRFKFYPKFTTNELETKEIQELISIWKKIIPNTDVDNNVDKEEWIENALLLLKATKKYKPENIYVKFASKPGYFVLNNRKRIIQEEVYELENVIVLGSTNIMQLTKFKNLIEPTINDIQKAESYFKFNTFFKYANRKCYIGSFREDNQNWRKVLNKLPDGNYIVKTCSQKYLPLFIYEVKDGVGKFKDFLNIYGYSNEKEMHTDIISQIGYAGIHMEGEKYGLLIQEYTKMNYEYRFIVKNQEIISGAGCVEEFTPLDRRSPNICDYQIRKNRLLGTDIIEDKEKVHIMHRYAQDVVNALKIEDDKFTNYIVDIALNENNEPLLVEINPFLNYGFYANKVIV